MSIFAKYVGQQSSGGGGGGGGVTSINGNTSAAQTIAGGAGITVTSSMGTTTISTAGSPITLTGDVTGSGTGTIATTAVSAGGGTGNFSVGNLLLPLSTTSPDQGQIFQNGVSIFSTFGSGGGEDNLFIGGPSAGPSGNFTLTGQGNFGLGGGTLASLTSGAGNVAIGQQLNVGYPLGSLTTGSNNMAIGTDAGAILSTGNNNTLIGNAAGDNLNMADSDNTFIGNESTGSPAGISQSTLIGSQAYASASINAMALGYNAAAPADNTVMIGNSSVVGMYLNGILNLPTSTLGVPGSVVGVFTNVPTGLSTTPSYVQVVINGVTGYIPFFHA